jgi:hypothetical protein
MFARNGGVMRRTSITIAQRCTLLSALVPEDSDKPVPSALEPDGFVPAGPAGLEPLDSAALEPAGPAALGLRTSGLLEPVGFGALVAGPDSGLELDAVDGFALAGPLSRVEPALGVLPLTPAGPVSRLLEVVGEALEPTGPVSRVEVAVFPGAVPAGPVSRVGVLGLRGVVPANPLSAVDCGVFDFEPAKPESLVAIGVARVLPADRVVSGAEPESPEGVGTPVSRVGTGFAAVFKPGAGPASRVAFGELAAFGTAPVSWVAPVELAAAVGRSVSRSAPEVVGAACVVGPASALEGGAVTVASLTGSGCAVGAFTGLSALPPAGLGSKALTDGLSVGSGAPGLILIVSRFNLIAWGLGNATRG